MTALAEGLPIKRPEHDAAPEKRVPAKTVATWPVGTFVENIVALPGGDLVVSIVSEHALAVVGPDGDRRTLASLPASPTGMSLVGDELFVSVGEPGSTGWSVYCVAHDGSFERLIDLPEARFLNGSTPLLGSRILVADSILGRVFEVDVRARTHGVWLEHELLRKSTAEPMMPGVNGIKAFRGHVYLTSTERSLVLRAATGEGGSAGPVEVLAERFVGDDFALDVDGNLYIATHVYNQVQRLSRDGTRTVLAGAEEGMHGSTALAFGRGAGDKHSLYVTTTGGIIAPIDGRVREAKLVRFDVGVEGAPLGL